MGKTTDTLRSLASQLAILEGKKSQARVSDIREVLKLLCVLDAKFVYDNQKTPYDLREWSPLELIENRSGHLLKLVKDKDAKAKKSTKKDRR
jgi:hypothetical protein